MKEKNRPDRLFASNLKGQGIKEVMDNHTLRVLEMAGALAEAEEIIRSAKTETRDIIKALKKFRLSENVSAIKELDKKHAEIKKAIEQYSPETLHGLENVIAGQRIFINTLGVNSVIHSINKKAGTCKVTVKGKVITVPLGDLSEPLKEKDIRASSEDKYDQKRAALYLSVDMDVPDELNIIGRRVEPALSILERYINDVSLSGIDRVRIIHGIGSGKLSMAVREYLKDHPLVESISGGSEEEGGDAVTVVFL